MTETEKKWNKYKWSQYYNRHKEKERARALAYYWAHREEILARQKKKRKEAKRLGA